MGDPYGFDDLPGTTVFTGERSRLGYRLNKLAMSLTSAENRRRFLADETGYMTQMGLGAGDQGLVAKRDWAEMIKRGGNIYVILKIAGTLGISLIQMGAQMRGESLEAFMATRPRRAARPRSS